MLVQIFVSSTLWWRDMQKVPRSMVQWPGTREWLPCTRYLVQCTRYLVQCTKYLEQSTKYLVHSVPGNIWQVFGTECTSYTPQASLLPPSLPPPPPDKVLWGTACPVWFSKGFVLLTLMSITKDFKINSLIQKSNICSHFRLKFSAAEKNVFFCCVKAHCVCQSYFNPFNYNGPFIETS